MDTWLNRDQQRQHRLEETGRGNSLEVFSAQKLPATATDTASATGTRNGAEKGGAGQARQFVVRRPVLQRRLLLRQPLFLAVLPLSAAVCRCLALSAAGLDSVDADADEMTPLLLRLLRGGCTVVPQHDRNLLDYTLIGHWSRKELTRINDAVFWKEKTTIKVKKFNLKQ